MSLRSKLIFAFLVVTLPVIVVGSISIQVMQNTTQHFTHIIEQNGPALIALGQLKATAARVQLEAVSLNLNQLQKSNLSPDEAIDPRMEIGELKEFEEAQARFNTLLETYQTLAISPARQEIATQIEVQGLRMYQISRQLIAIEVNTVQIQEILILRENLEEAEEAIFEIIDEAIELERQEFEQEYGTVNSQKAIIFNTSFGFILISFLLAVILASIVTNFITTPIIRARTQGLMEINQHLRSEITEHQRAERELRKHADIVAASQELIVLLDTDYIHQVVSQSYLTAYNLTKADIIGHKVTKVIPETTFNRKIKPLLDQVLAGQKIQQQVWLSFPGLGRRYVDTTYQPIYTVDDTPTYVLMKGLDITDLKETQESLQKSNNQLETLYQMSRNIGAAPDEQALLDVLAVPAIEAGAFAAALIYIDLNEQDEPEMLEIVAAWESEPVEVDTVGLKLPVQDFLLSNVWMQHPDQPLFIVDCLTDDRVDESTQSLMTHYNYRAMCLTPLNRNGRWIGQLGLFWNEPHVFSHREQEIYQALIGVASATVENRRLFVKQQQVVTETLYQISQSLNVARCNQDILQAVVEPNLKHLQGGIVNLLAIESGQDDTISCIEFLATWTENNLEYIPPGATFTLEDFPMPESWLANPKEIFLLTDIETDTRLNEETRETYRQQGIQAEVIIPLIQGHRWVGLLGFSWLIPHTFSHQEIVIYQALSTMVSPPLENLRLLHNLEQLVAERTADLIKFKTLAESSSDGILILDLDAKKPIYINRPAYKLFGYNYDNQELTDKPLDQLFPERNMSELAKIVIPYVFQKGPWLGEMTQTRKNNTTFDASVAAFALPTRDDEPTMIALNLRDITHRKQTERQLEVMHQISHELNLVRSFDDLIHVLIKPFLPKGLSSASLFCFDLDEQGRPEWAEMVATWTIPNQPTSPVGTRYKIADFPFAQVWLSNNYSPTFIPDVDVDERIDLLLREVYKRSEIRAVIIIPLTLGSQWVGLAGYQWNIPHEFTPDEIAICRNIMGLTAVSVQNQRMLINLQREIDEHKRTEEALRQAKELAETANRAKSVFLANMSHELRTPLNAILGYAQIIRRDKTLPTQLFKGITIIQQSGEHLLTLLNDILDISKIEAGKMELRVTEFHLADFLQNITEIFRLRAQEKKIIFKYQILSPIPQAVAGDQKRLRQVLINLLGNAIKFTHQGEVILNVRMQDEKIRFEIQDTGIGIPPQEVERIFAPFHQVDNQNNFIEGTGLGLAISQRLVQMMGGQLSVDSEVDVGSTFWFELTLTPIKHWIETSYVQQLPIIGYREPRRTILIVDDKPANRDVFIDMLSPLGFDIIEAVNGQDALNKAIEFEPDLILMDLVMPVMDGFEAIRQIRDKRTLEDVIIIAISASAFSESQQKSIMTGSNSFMVKPFQLEDLLAEIDSLLDIKWVYKESITTTDVFEKQLSGQFMVPPQEILQRLFNYALKGKIVGLRDEIKKLESEEYAPFISLMQDLIKSFKLKQIRQILREHLDA